MTSNQELEETKSHSESGSDVQEESENLNFEEPNDTSSGTGSDVSSVSDTSELSEEAQSRIDKLRESIRNLNTSKYDGYFAKLKILEEKYNTMSKKAIRTAWMMADALMVGLWICLSSGLNNPIGIMLSVIWATIMVKCRELYCGIMSTITEQLLKFYEMLTTGDVNDLVTVGVVCLTCVVFVVTILTARSICKVIKSVVGLGSGLLTSNFQLENDPHSNYYQAFYQPYQSSYSVPSHTEVPKYFGCENRRY